jgi:hypothetical protein
LQGFAPLARIGSRLYSLAQKIEDCVLAARSSFVICFSVVRVSSMRQLFGTLSFLAWPSLTPSEAALEFFEPDRRFTAFQGGDAF